jgi:Tat protein translocase TatB subunit
MFNVGGMELLVIAVLALVVLGPEKLPGAIRQIGQVTGELRRISKGFQTDLRGALDEAEREAEAARNAAAAAPDRATPDPGAARAAAQAELAAIEGAADVGSSDDGFGAEGRSVSPQPIDPRSADGDDTASKAS